MTQRANIDKQTLEHLAALSRFSIDHRREAKLLRDFEGIVGYFQNIQDLSLGPIEERRVPIKELREDIPRTFHCKEGNALLDMDTDGYLSVPPVF